MSCINMSGTKVVRAGKDLSMEALLSAIQNKDGPVHHGCNAKSSAYIILICVNIFQFIDQ